MIIRPVSLEEKNRFNAVAHHPLQSWEWGDFRKATGQKVERYGVFDDSGQMQDAIQVTFHSIPVLGGTAGYFPRGPQPTGELLSALKDIGQRNNAVFIKLEPNIMVPAEETNAFAAERQLLEEAGAVPGQQLFTQFTFVKDLRPSEEEILNSFKSKTRYNVRLARKRGVQIVEDTSLAGLEKYLDLLRLTTDRQNFYAHDESYFRKQWEIFGKSGIMRILLAEFEGKILTAWIIFLFNGVGYYPYGASSRENPEVMASNLMMWEALMLAKREGCTAFDMWGALGPDAPADHKWSGFHRFKEGYSGELMRAMPTYDLVLNSPLYSLFRLGNAVRWKLLRLRAKLGR